MRIKTRTIAATDFEGTFIEATDGDTLVRGPRNYGSSPEEQHYELAERVARARVKRVHEHPTGYFFESEDSE